MYQVWRLLVENPLKKGGCSVTGDNGGDSPNHLGTRGGERVSQNTRAGGALQFWRSPKDTQTPQSPWRSPDAGGGGS